MKEEGFARKGKEGSIFGLHHTHSLWLMLFWRSLKLILIVPERKKTLLDTLMLEKEEERKKEKPLFSCFSIILTL